MNVHYGENCTNEKSIIINEIRIVTNRKSSLLYTITNRRVDNRKTYLFKIYNDIQVR